MSMQIDNRFKYFKDINESLKRKYQTTEDFPYSQMAEAIDNIPSGAEIVDVEINSEGHLIVTFSDGTTMDAGYIGIPTISIATATVTLSTNSYVYDGTSKLPAVQNVVLDGVSLVELQDYVVISNAEVNAGSYLILIQGIGNYSGAASANWNISKAQATISGNGTINIDLGDTATETYTTTGDGTMSFSIADPTVATISNSGNTVTITSVAEGTTTLTVTVADGDNYFGATKTVNVEVERAVTIFGVMWDYSLSSPALTRLTPQTDPLSVVTNVPSTEPTACVGTSGGSSEFDNYMPWRGMVRKNYVNGQIVDFTGYDNGETFVYIPEFWSKIVDDTEHSTMYFYISSAELEGFTKHSGSGRYVGRYELDSNFKSVTGNSPKVNTTLGGFRTGITGLDSSHFQYDIHTYNAIQLLYIIEFANLNSQAMIGSGYTRGSSTLINGNSDTLTYHTGRSNGASNNVSAVQYRWIENLWGNVACRIDGILINGGTAYICNDTTKYSDSITSDYINTGLSIPSTNGYYEKGQSYSSQYLLPKSSTGGSNSTFACDYFTSGGSSSGLRVIYVGGGYGNIAEDNVNNGSGLFSFAYTYAPTYYNETTSSRSILVIQNGGDS